MIGSHTAQEQQIRPIRLRSGQTGWLVTGHRAARQALTDPRLHARTAAIGDNRALADDVKSAINSHMLNLEPPDHTRLRSLLSGAFTRPRMEQLRPEIQRITDDLLDRIPRDTEVDLIESLALPLPIRVLCHLLGIPERDSVMLHGWTEILTASARPLEQLDSAVDDMLAYVRALLEQKRQAPGTDPLSTLVAARHDQGLLSDHELTSTVFLLLTAGHETTVNLIGNAVLTLMTRPAQLAQLRERPDLLPAAIDEILRYEGPTKGVLRRAAEPVELAGVAIPAGAVVIVSVPVANRDPGRFAAPETVDVARTDNPHLTFGHGIHHCLGAPLARLEGVIAVGAFLARYRRIEFAVPPENLTWRSSMFLHGLAALPVRLS